MKATVTRAFPGRPDHEPLARTIEAGEVIAGDLAAAAVRSGFAEEIEAKQPVRDDEGVETTFKKASRKSKGKG